MQPVEQSRLEMGGDLYNLAVSARKWFIDNNVEVPTSSKVWQKLSVRRKEIPPGTNVGALRTLGITPRVFISLLLNREVDQTKYQQNIITNEVAENSLGLRIESYHYRTDRIHKVCSTTCLACGHTEDLDYGTLVRMLNSGNKFCRLCRDAGGKQKPESVYDRFEGFIPIKIHNSRAFFECTTCGSTISRGLGHCKIAEYLVCEICNPRVVSGAKIETEFGLFDSKIEYLAFQKLLQILPENTIIERQKSYNVLFNTNTKHTADFYIPALDLVLEVTTSSNNLGKKYSDTMQWKLSISPKVKLALSVKEVEDIVRPLLKNKGLTVVHGRSLLRGSTEWRH